MKLALLFISIIFWGCCGQEVTYNLDQLDLSIISKEEFTRVSYNYVTPDDFYYFSNSDTTTVLMIDHKQHPKEEYNSFYDRLKCDHFEKNTVYSAGDNTNYVTLNYSIIDDIIYSKYINAEKGNERFLTFNFGIESKYKDTHVMIRTLKNEMDWIEIFNWASTIDVQLEGQILRVIFH